MEQKTEAYQAVDPDMLDSVTSKVAEFYPQSTQRDMEKNQRLARAIFRLVNRAALKAQPAPTEAPNFCATYGKRLHAGSIHTCTPPAYAETPAHECITRENDALVCTACGTTSPIEWVVLTPTEAAQGEDSARLDAAIREALKDTHIEDGTKGAFNMVVNELVCAIIRARASAETGGVKP